jgi:thiol:disulfide interchange protein DsbD
LAGVLAGYFGQNLSVLFQTPWILATFSGIFVALAFSMFGYYDIQLPSVLQSKITSLSNQQKGGNLIGVGIMGFLSALIVGPCVAPPLAGALIYIGQTGDALLGGMALFVMSLGMGVPLLAIGAGVSKLPKAGGWMDNIKSIFGIMMLGVAIFLLDRIISNITSLILWGLLFTVASIAMGALERAQTTWQRIFKALSLIVFGYGVLLLLLVARGGGDMFTPLADFNTTNTTTAPGVKTHVVFESITSSAELDKILAESTKNGKMVMLDFYADWCISCKELEKFVFAKSAVVTALKNFKTLQADVTKNTLDDKFLMKRFGIVGPPAILFFKNGKILRSKTLVGFKNEQDFLAHIKNL